MFNFYKYLAAFAVLFSISAANATTNYTVINNSTVKTSVVFYVYSEITKADTVLSNQTKTISTVDNITDITVRPSDANWGGVTIKFSVSKVQNNQIKITSTQVNSYAIIMTISSNGVQIGQSTFTKKLKI